MEKRILGRTGLKATALGLGAMELGRLDEKAAGDFLNDALDNGINYIDTCPEYRRSEEFIGKMISRRRGEYILATKCGDNLSGVGEQFLFDRRTVESNIDNSLKMLRTDYIDILQIHGGIEEYFPTGERNETMDAMLAAQKAGKVRFLGVSIRNGRSGEPRHPAGFGYDNLPVFSRWGAIDVIQAVYGGLTRASENEIARAAERGVGIVARGVVKQYRPYYETLYRFAKLDELQEAGETSSDFLIRYAVSHSSISTMIVGTASMAHNRANIAAANRGRLPDDVYAEAKRRLDAAGIVAGDAAELSAVYYHVPKAYMHGQ
jgi:aryl-alcohol dehydrogenase-like predicted oxidoreductase